MIPNPDQNTAVSTFEHPVQSFVWDDFTGKPDHEYDYYFYPLKGSPKNIDRTSPPILINIKTESLYTSAGKHNVFFNRGTASSQAYFRQFHNATPGTIADPTKLQQVYDWLARDLKNAMLKFIQEAKKGDTLLCCFYEFRHQPIAEALKKAHDNGVTVRIIIDAKTNKENFPRNDNLALIKKVGLPKKCIIERTANPNCIQHNKFMILLKGKKQLPSEVWTGSTNISDGGIFGQTNVGHWVKDSKTAQNFATYWEILSKDPGGKAREDRVTKMQRNAEYKQKVTELQQDITPKTIPQGITTIFSPRLTPDMLTTYAKLLDDAKDVAAITLAFGISDVFKKILQDNTAKDQITFMLLEKKDAPKPGTTKEFTKLAATNNVYQAWGSYIKDPLYQWAKEVNNQIIKLNHHVMYIHSKFLLVDPLGDDPIVITGSANFSKASTVNNDENMLIIRGDKRVADIYFTEFNRLFNHYYFRSVYESVGKQASSDSLFLLPNDDWLQKYKPGTLRHKRVKMFVTQ